MEEYGVDLPNNLATMLRHHGLQGRSHRVELHQFDRFMAALRKQFEDPFANQEVQIRIKTFRQGKRPVTAYIKEFRSLASKLEDWPKDMLIKCFQEGLTNELFYTCPSRGMPRTLQSWYGQIHGIREMEPLARLEEENSENPGWGESHNKIKLMMPQAAN